MQSMRKEAGTMKFRRWKLEKYDYFTQKPVEITPPEPRRLYWTWTGAIAEEIRLNSGLARGRARWRYRAVRR